MSHGTLEVDVAVGAAVTDVGEEVVDADADGEELVGVLVVVVAGVVVEDGGLAACAVNAKVPETGCPSAEVARHATLYLPAGPPRSGWCTVVPSSRG